MSIPFFSSSVPSPSPVIAPPMFYPFPSPPLFILPVSLAKESGLLPTLPGEKTKARCKNWRGPSTYGPYYLQSWRDASHGYHMVIAPMTDRHAHHNTPHLSMPLRQLWCAGGCQVGQAGAAVGAWHCPVASRDYIRLCELPLPLTVSCYSKIQIGFTFLVPAYPGYPGKEAVKWLLLLLLWVKALSRVHTFPDQFYFASASRQLTALFLASCRIVSCLQIWSTDRSWQYGLWSEGLHMVNDISVTVKAFCLAGVRIAREPASLWCTDKKSHDRMISWKFLNLVVWPWQKNRYLTAKWLYYCYVRLAKSLCHQ